MDDLYLREFLDLARTLNFQESADNMNISTSSLSKHIKKMESELNVLLFDRSTRSVTLSPYGEALVGYAEKIVDLHDAYLSEIRKMHSQDLSEVRIGFLPSLGQYGVLDIIQDFCKEEPKVTLNIQENRHVEQLLLDKNFDFVFGDSFGATFPNIERLTILKDHAVAVLPPDHPLAGEKKVSLIQLKEEKLIVEGFSASKLTPFSQKIMETFLHETGDTPEVHMITKYISTVLQMVEQERGISIMNSMVFSSMHSNKCVAVDLDPEISFTMYAGYLPDHICTKNQKKFLTYLKKIARKNTASAVVS